MTDRPPDPEDRTHEPDDERPGSDPGAAYDAAERAGQVPTDEVDENGPGVGDVFRSGS